MQENTTKLKNIKGLDRRKMEGEEHADGSRLGEKKMRSFSFLLQLVDVLVSVHGGRVFVVSLASDQENQQDDEAVEEQQEENGDTHGNETGLVSGESSAVVVVMTRSCAVDNARSVTEAVNDVVSLGDSEDSVVANSVLKGQVECAIDVVCL